MTWLRTTVDADNLLERQFTELERKQLPFVAMQAINKTAWEVRVAWGQQIGKVFDRPTPLTQRAVLYRKATRAKLFAEIFIRDEAFKGNPPSKYLQAQVAGGSRRHKRMELRMQHAGVMPPGSFAVPGHGARLDAYGNVPGRVITAILSAVGAQHDQLQNATAASRQRRKTRRRKRGGEYFALKNQHGKLRPGVYERINTGFGSAVRSVLIFVNGVQYRPRFDIDKYTVETYDRMLPFFFERELQKALATSGGSR